ncbi:MAG: class I SAM-dependent methyltransferase [Patescibacteria group bacterium]
MTQPHQWSEEQASSAQTPNFGKKFVVEPTLLELLGDVKGKRILELGSGNGYWLQLLSKRGAHCTGVERSEQQLILARLGSQSEKIQHIQADIGELGGYGLAPETYDTILLEHVLLEISSKDALQNIFKNAFLLLKKGGHLIVSDLHPFAPSSHPENIHTPDNFTYFSSGDVFETTSRRIDGQETKYRDHHWTLEDLTSPITTAGFHIAKIVEPRPSRELTQQYPHLAYRLSIPMSIMIVGIKE